MPDHDPRGYRPGVGVLVLNRAGLVWVGQRAGAPTEAEGPGQWWQMPQGGIDEDEDPARAALRELEEETGIGKDSVRILAETSGWLSYDLPWELRDRAWGGRFRGQRQKWFAMRFLGSDEEIEVTPPGGLEPEFIAWRWVPMSDLPALIAPFKREVYAAVVAEFAPFARPIANA